jgi:hypothetical protein
MLQNASHETERVRQAALFERSAEGGSRFTGT